MSGARDLRWRALLPSPWAWAHVLASATSYLLVVALLVTMAAKLPVVRELEGVTFWPSRWLISCLPDVAFFFGLAAVLSVGERASRWVAFATVPIAMFVTVFAIINAGYLSISGDQLSVSVLLLGLERFGDVQKIASGLDLVGAPTIVLGILLIGLLPASVLVVRRYAPRLDHAERCAQRARACGVSAVIGALLAFVLPEPNDYALSHLGSNAVVRAAIDVTRGSLGRHGTGTGTFARYDPQELVAPEAVTKLRAGAHPNIVVIVLESTRRDATSLTGPDAPASTPNLVALAARGTELTTMRAVVPHTTKSLWTMLCGRLPLMQHTTPEVGSNIELQCLPSVLAAAGWRTAFLQSAVGYFEDRPRLVARMGFRHFVAADHLTQDTLGYLAGDDDLLVSPLESWLDEAGGQPFLATLLTSATHHPYELTRAATAEAVRTGRPIESDRDRYHRQIEAADAMVGKVIELLRRRGLIDTTLVVVVGDHGEGFGDKGVRQHDSNFYEEGLRVPFVIAGPGVPQGRSDTATSLIDLPATLLDVLDSAPSPAALAASPGRSALRPTPGRVLPFGCFVADACRGFVRDQTKVVHLPARHETFSFDLTADPEERTPRPLTDELAKTLADVESSMEAHRVTRWIIYRPELELFPRWRCPNGRDCGPIDPLRARRGAAN